jgi:torulene dioxygenase
MLDGIIKYDSETGEHRIWECFAHTPGEAVFVADPEGTKEDDGVLLSVVLDGRLEKSYLLVLDARTMTEVARAEMNIPVGFGFHGKHVGNGGNLVEY